MFFDKFRFIKNHLPNYQKNHFISFLMMRDFSRFMEKIELLILGKMISSD